MSFVLCRWMPLIFSLFFLVPALRAQQMLQNVPAELVQFPDLILYNGKIATMNDASLSNAQGSIVQAVAIGEDRILFIGSNDEVMRYAGPATQKVDLKGRTVVPGLINTHTHMHDHALWLWANRHPRETDSVMKRISVGGSSFDELTRGIELAIQENTGKLLPGQWAWIDLPAKGESTSVGLGTQYMLQGVMTREKLDELAPNLPIFLHGDPKWLLNTTARNAFFSMYEVPTTDASELGISMNTTFRRSLMIDGYFGRHLDELADIIEDGLKHQAALGFTTFSSHIEPLRVHDAYQKLVRAGRMPIRLAYADSHCEQVQPDKAGCLLHKGDIAGQGDKFFWNVGVTLRGIDAEPPEICSTMEAPKEVKEREKCRLMPGSATARGARAALLSRLRFLVNHSYGDKGMDYMMDIIEDVMMENPTITLDYIRSLRISADHCGFYPRKSQIPRMVNLGMIISCGGRMVDRSSPWLKVYGDNYADRISPIKSMLSGGLMVVAEGEFHPGTGESSTVFAQYIPLITRKDTTGKLIAPEEAIDRVTLLKMATVWASYYVLKETELGTIEPGKFADILVFNKDYFSVPESELSSVYPVMTVVGGKPLVVREEYAGEAGLAAVGPQMKFEFQLEKQSEQTKRPNQ